MSESLERSIGRIEGKIDLVLERTAVQAQALEKIDTRVTVIEEWRWKLLGASAAVGAIAGFAVKVLL